MNLEAATARLRLHRRIHGIAAVLLPYTPGGSIAWPAFERLVAQTRATGLDAAVNMDTGFGDLLTPSEREAVLDATRSALGPNVPFYAGAYADPTAADPVPSYHAAIAAIGTRGAIPVIIQCHAMHGMSAADKAAMYAAICGQAARAIGFELGPVFAPHGEIWSDETFARLLAIPQLIGAKHSSLDRDREFQRLAIRDRERPDFAVYTGNDLAIDMVAYGSDYLLGLAAFAPAAFAARDAAFASNEAAFLSHNDALQYLGNVGFRRPVPAYKHSAAMYLHLTGQLDSDAIHPRAALRPASDRIMLYDCALRVGALDDPERTYRERVAPFI